LAAQHVGLVKWIARRLRMGLPAWIELHELVGDGTLGLVRAAGRFDPERGVPFSRFAGPLIRGAMLDGLRRRTHARRTTRRKAWLSGTQLAVDDARFDTIDAADQAGVLLDRLPARDRQIAELFFIRGISLKELSRQMRISQPRAFQILSRAVHSMRRQVDGASRRAA
jgi:RNA polymerase sigma factor for flagellar operon FliA